MLAKKFCSDATARLLLCRVYLDGASTWTALDSGPDLNSRADAPLRDSRSAIGFQFPGGSGGSAINCRVPGRRNVSCQLRFDLGGGFFHRASAARRAISDRCSAVNFCALALPPTKPPRRPSVTAAGFLCFLGSASGWRTRARCGLSWLAPRTFFPIFLHKNDAAGFLDNSKNLLCNLNDFFPFVCG